MTAGEQHRGAELLQWFGLFGAALVWTAQFVIGYGVTLAACSPGTGGWGLDVDTWEVTLMAIGIPLAALSEAAAITILRETRALHHEDPPPWGRRHFFASAAVLGNLLFLTAILLSGIGAIYTNHCQGA